MFVYIYVFVCVCTRVYLCIRICVFVDAYAFLKAHSLPHIYKFTILYNFMFLYSLLTLCFYIKYWKEPINFRTALVKIISDTNRWHVMNYIYNSWRFYYHHLMSVFAGYLPPATFVVSLLLRINKISIRKTQLIPNDLSLFTLTGEQYSRILRKYFFYVAPNTQQIFEGVLTNLRLYLFPDFFNKWLVIEGENVSLSVRVFFFFF